MQPNTFCFNFKLLSKNRYGRGMCSLHLAALIDPIGRKENVFFRETVYSWILWNMARYYYRNILQTSAAYKSIYKNDKGMSIFPICLFLFHKHAISPVYLNRRWLFLIKDMFKHIDRNHKFAFYLSCENSHGTLHKHWDA